MSIILKQLTIPLCDLRLQKSLSDLKLNNIQLIRTEDHEENDREIYQGKEESGEDEEKEYEVKKVQVVKKIVKILDNDSKKILNAYEQMIEKNREEKMAILQSLKLDEAKANLAEVLQKKSQSGKRKFTKSKIDTLQVLRKSRRIAKINGDLSEDTLYCNAIKAASEEQNRKIILPEMSFKEALMSAEFYESYVKDVNIQESKSEYRHFSYDKSVLKKMIVKESNIAKVTPARITSLTWYPSPEQLIVAAGNKYGKLGVWNVDSKSDPYVFNIHYEGITNLQFNPLNQVQLVSSSYDGVLRCGDLVHHTFNQIYNVSHETCCTYFDILSSTTYLVAQKNGQVALVDKRTMGKSYEMKHTCHEYSIKTVNTHPVNRNFFVTAENKGSIRLWDLRKLQKIPVADITYHKRCVHSAFFSPITGNSILATSSDDSVSIFDSTNLTSDIKMKQQMKHNNQTGRWLSVFRAMWLPNSEEGFVIGSMQYPRIIQVFDKNMSIYSIMMHENLTTITSTNAFHPMRPVLAGGNSSGKVFIFT